MTSSPTPDPVQDALDFIESDLSADLSVSRIAREVSLSSFYFQRIFFRDTGETVAGYVRNRRLERAATAIAGSRKASIIDAAMTNGFETHSAFSRAFRARFGMSPREFAQGGADSILRQTDNARPFLKPQVARSFEVQVDIVDLPPLWFHYRSQRGVSQGKFFSQPLSVAHDLESMLVQHDDSLVALCGGFRSGPESFTDPHAIGYYGGLFTAESERAWSGESAQIRARNWAVFAHHGPYERLHMTWNKVLRNWIPNSELLVENDWMFESYISTEVAPNKNTFSAQIYLPLRSGAQMEQNAK